jgi:hypothetical protein
MDPASAHLASLFLCFFLQAGAQAGHGAYQTEKDPAGFPAGPFVRLH